MISKISVLDSCDKTVKSICFDSFETGLNKYVTYKAFTTFRTFDNGFSFEKNDNLVIVEFINENLEDLYARY